MTQKKSVVTVACPHSWFALIGEYIFKQRENFDHLAMSSLNLLPSFLSLSVCRIIVYMLLRKGVCSENLHVV